VEFDTFVRDGGFDPATINDAQRKTLTAAWKQAIKPPDDPPAKRAPAEEELNAKLQLARDEEARKQKIVDIVAEAIQQDSGFIETAEALGRQAIEAKWTIERFENEMLRARRPNAGTFFYTPMKPEVTDAVIEASVCRAAGLNEIEKYYDEKTLEAAHRAYPRGMRPTRLIEHYARRGGYTGSVQDDLSSAIRAARKATEIQAAGSWGPSTTGASIGSMLAAVANKFLRAAFDAVESSWRQIAAVRSAPDFKQITTWSLTGDLTFKKLPPGGEIKHGQVDATSYTNQVDTFARMLGLDRRDLINDDLSAFGQIARRLGRGGAIALNRLFWGIFLNNSAVFTSGRNNLITGAGTTLQLSQLDVLNQKFLLQTDPDGNILAVNAAILLVPPALAVTAQTLMSSTMVASGATTAPGTPTTNPWAGKFRVVTSAYMQDSTLTGNSATAWYLIADPNDLPLIEVAFLNGQQTPIVEESDSDFGMLGRAYRGYFDIGVAIQEYRAGAKSAGA
jgi:phage major head subunit gpT-like protein